ncbi:hypothetical protein DL96DRAFT_1584483 [Flagelloscypha sp. PMI_526]|nr:hypothetical protein DL96DRAFT_1584483 [Flagelloscypha sp. PMI_526]
MSAAYSDFFASGLKNSSSRSKSRFSTMSLDIPMGNNGFAPDACSRTSSPAIDSPLLHFESPLADLMDSSDMTPTTAGTPKANGQGRLLRKRRSSLSLAVGVQGNTSAIKSPSRAVQVSRARSGSTASFTTTATESSDQVRIVGRARSGSIGSALKSSKRRSMKMGLAPPPLPPPRLPLPDLPSFRSVLSGDIPDTAPPDMTSFNIQPLRSPLTVRSFQYMPHSDSAMKSSPIREAFDFSGHDQQMKEN